MKPKANLVTVQSPERLAVRTCRQRGTSDHGRRPQVPKRDYRTAMREFVRAISTQAKKADSTFLVVPQGGVGLLANKGKPAAEYLKHRPKSQFQRIS